MKFTERAVQIGTGGSSIGTEVKRSSVEVITRLRILLRFRIFGAV
jgi:hypothetical protein